MTTLFVLLFRLILLSAFTFGFVVLFEHGPSGFSAGVKPELETFVSFVKFPWEQARAGSGSGSSRDPGVHAGSSAAGPFTDPGACADSDAGIRECAFGLEGPSVLQDRRGDECADSGHPGSHTLKIGSFPPKKLIPLPQPSTLNLWQ